MKALLLSLLVLSLAACESVGEIGAVGDTSNGVVGPDGGIAPVRLGAGGGGGATGAAGSAVAGGGSQTGVGSDLPCDVQALLAAHCTSCHASSPAGGAPMPLITYANLLAPARSDPTRTVAEMALARMQDASRPMPPAPLARVSAAEIATFSSWVAGNYLAPACGSAGGAGGSSGGGAGGSSGGGAGGSSGGGAGGAPGGPFDVPAQCTSGAYWSGSVGNELMNPGLACINCHSREDDAPRFTLAGTVYPTAHEPDRCDGADGRNGAQVTITDAGGKSVTLTPNAAGNFFYKGSVTFPIQAKVTYMGRERAMGAMQSTGDCNGCHTQSGANGAPGRILLP